MKNATLPKNVPVKWVLAILAIAVIYGFLQPTLNKRFGLQLPSIGELAEQRPAHQPQIADSSDGDEQLELGPTAPTNGPNTANESTDSAGADSARVSSAKVSSETGDSSRDSEPRATVPDATKVTKSADPLDFLETIGNQTYRSPQGLIYRRGSAEGHRLKHLERHLRNDASRPGSHGVFEGDMVEFLTKIDDAYQRAKRKDKGTKQYDEEGRTIYEASFAKSIGYLGGEQGKRRKNPKLNRLRLVVDGEAVITAFPF